MLPDKAIFCHRTGFTKKCHELVTKGKCNRWKMVPLENPTSKEPITQYDCIDNWMFILQFHALKLQSETGASVDKVATEVAKNGTATADTLIAATQRMAEAAAHMVGHAVERLETQDMKLIEGKKN